MKYDYVSVVRKYLLIIFCCLQLNSTSYGEHQIFHYDLLWFPYYEVTGSDQYYKFDLNLTTDEEVQKEIKNYKKTGLVSYLLYENDAVVIDEKSRDYWLTSDKISEEKKVFKSNSVGKSLASYIVGHAICEGYIDNVDVILDDWSVLNNTLYKNQKLIDLLNMKAGDQKYIGEKNFYKVDRLNDEGRSVNLIYVKSLMENSFQNTKKSASVYNYSALATNVLLNYTIFKVGKDYKELLNKIFKEHVKVKNTIYFTKNGTDDAAGSGRYTFYATRYDYLRIGKRILDDWNNDNCVGKYLKTIYDQRINKNRKGHNTQSASQYSKKYGGQFHFDIIGLSKKKILAMDGMGGQQLIVDFDSGRIIVVNSIDRHYNWKKIVHKKLKQK